MTVRQTPLESDRGAPAVAGRSGRNRVLLHVFLAVAALIWLFPLLWAVLNSFRDYQYTAAHGYASFGGFGPLREPRLVGYVMLDTPRGGIYYGGQVAAPVFERILADAFAYLRVPPDDDPWEAREEELKAKAEKARAAEAARRSKPIPRDEDDEEGTPTLLVTSPGQVPDLRGKAVRDAVAGLVTRGYRTRVDGDGVVVRQSPPPGTLLAAGQACTLHLGDPQQLIDDEKRARATAKAAAAATLLAESQSRGGTRRPARKRP